MRGKIFVLTPSTFKEIMTEKVVFESGDLPADANFVRAWTDQGQNIVVNMLFEHGSFDDVPDGAHFPSETVEVVRLSTDPIDRMFEELIGTKR